MCLAITNSFLLLTDRHHILFIDIPGKVLPRVNNEYLSTCPAYRYLSVTVHHIYVRLNHTQMYHNITCSVRKCYITHNRTYTTPFDIPRTST